MLTRFVVALVASLFVASVPVSGQAPLAPQAQPLLQPGDIKKLGSFSVPEDCGFGGNPNSQQSFMAYGGAPLGISPRGIFIGGYDARGLNRGGPQIAEFTIPALAGTATLLTKCTNVPGLDQAVQDGRLGGILIDEAGRALVSAYNFYGDHTTKSHMAFNLATLSSTPFVRLGSSLPAGYYAGTMTLVPPEWRPLLGCDMLTGQGSLSIISRTSSGPSAHCVNAADIGTRDPVPATALISYPLDHPLRPHVDGASNTVYQRSDHIGGMVWVPGTRTLLYITRHGDGAQCYGEVPPCNDPAGSDKGDHNFPYVPKVLAYDALHLLDVKQGRLKEWQVQPYATWTLTGIEDTGRFAMRPGGVTFDPKTRRIYIAPQWGGGARSIFVYQVGTAAPPPQEVCGDGVDNDGDGLIDEGCPTTPPDIFEHVEVVTVPASTVTVPAQTVTVPAQTITRTLLCSRSKGTCVEKR